MARICSICTHSKRSQIDLALIRSDSLRNIAEQTGTSATALHRHKNTCLASQVAQARQESAVAAASNVVDELLKITSITSAVLTRALSENDNDLALRAIARLERQLELKGRLLGQLEEREKPQTVVQVVYVDKQLNASTPAAAAKSLSSGSERQE